MDPKRQLQFIYRVLKVLYTNMERRIAWGNGFGNPFAQGILQDAAEALPLPLSSKLLYVISLQ